MSKPRVKVRLVCTTLVKANLIKTAIESFLVGKSIFDVISFRVFQDIAGNNLVIGDWRFNTLVDRDAVRDGCITARTTNAPSIVSARISWHNCTHDDPSVQSCYSSSYEEVS